MYLSFIEEERSKLMEQIEALDNIEGAIEGKCDDIIHAVQEFMRDEIYEAISDVFADFDIEDNYFDERRQEVQDVMQEHIESNL